MLDLQRTKPLVDHEFKIKAGETVSEEGIVLVQDNENDIEVVKPSTGTSDVFVGFSYGQTMSPLTKSKVENLTVPGSSPYTVELAREPISGQIYIVNEDGTEQTAGDPALNANEYSISGKVITFHSGQAGKVETITYRYSPTALELSLQDNLPVTSITGTDLISQIGAIQAGDIYTNIFDAGVAWAFGAGVGMAAGGLIGASGANNIPGAIVIHVPVENLPFVGVRF